MRYFFYFIYIGWHWNFNLAWFVIRHERAGERRYGLRTTGTYNLADTIAKADRPHATWYEPVNYSSAGRLFDKVQPADVRTHFLDVGCGKGRVLAIAAAYGFRRLTGIDFSPRLCAAARRVQAALERQYPGIAADIQCINVRDYDLPGTVGVIFLFNPFDEAMMELFVEKVKTSLHHHPRPLKVLYANPQCKQLWLNAGFEETAAFEKLHHLRGSVLEFSAGKNVILPGTKHT